MRCDLIQYILRKVEFFLDVVVGEDPENIIDKYTGCAVAVMDD